MPAEPYIWQNVQIVAGGFVPGIEFSTTEKNLFLCNADIGGGLSVESKH